MTPDNLLTEWARLLMATFEAAGVRDVVISPGSRSTPFAWAALEQSGLRCHSVLDERSAGFFALGQARETGRPSLLLCTSGTAGAHYLPAVIEAGLASLPLLVLTADRPFELQECAAPQTVDQIRLYGAHARLFVELGGPDPDPGALRGLQRRAAHAVERSTAPLPGAVHLNARARKPLEPFVARDASGEALRDVVDALVENGPSRVARPAEAPHAEAVQRLADVCRLAERGVVVCGPSPVDGVDHLAAAALAAATGFPILAESTSQLRFGRLAPAPEGPVLGALDPILEALDMAGEAPPDLVLQVGGPPTSGTWARYVETHRPERHVLAPEGWPDPAGDAATLLLGPTTATLFALAEAAAPAPDPQTRAAWRERLARIETLAWRLVDEELEAADAGELGEPAAVRSAVAGVPDGATLVLANSLPVREVDAYCRPAARELRIGHQRGANGIDGLVSGAAGMASASGRPTAVLLGDLAFLHDTGGLWPAREIETPLAIVVLDNGGGRIFEQLPLARTGVSHEALRHWVTPHRLHLEGAAALYGIPVATPESTGAVSAAVAEALDREGPSLVLVRVAPHSAAATRESLRQRLAAAVRSGEAA